VVEKVVEAAAGWVLAAPELLPLRQLKQLLIRQESLEDLLQ
jgi:hypothetical protein